MELEVPKKKKGGRYSYEEKRVTVMAVVRHMASGRTLAKACKMLGKRPDVVRGWILRDEDFAWMYRQARLMMAQALVDEALEIAEKTTNHTIGQDRLRIDTLKWVASRMNPAEFGDRQILDGRNETTLEIKIVEETPSINASEKPLQVTARAIEALPSGETSH